MKLHLDKEDDILLIRGYRTDQITIGDHTFDRSLILSPTRLIDNWQARNLNDLSEQDFERMLELEPEVVLLGTGETLTFPQQSVTRPLIERGVGLEVMNTPAACRTYNILASEGRQVVASLLIG